MIGVGAGVSASKTAKPVHATESPVEYGPATFSGALPTDGYWTGVGGGSYCGGYGKNKSNAWSVSLDFNTATGIDWSTVDFDETVSLATSVKAAGNSASGNVVLSIDNTAVQSNTHSITSGFGSGSNSSSAKAVAMNIDSVSSSFTNITINFPAKSFITEFSCELSFTEKSSSGGDTPVTYSIIYNKNTDDAVTGMPSNQTGLEAGTYDLSDAIPVRSEYDFGGWAETSDGTEPITSVTISDANKTVYAIWTERVVSETFVKYTGNLANGDYVLTYGSVAMGNVVNNSSKILNSTLSLPTGNDSIIDPIASAVYRIESVDVGGTTYWTLKNSSNDKYVKGATSTNMTLSNDSSDNANKYKVTVSNNAYDFLCKATENASTKRYIRSYNGVWGSYAAENGGALTLYKKSVSYTVLYNNNGGSGTMENSVNTVSACTFTAPSGKEFDHWNTAADNSGASYNPGDAVLESCTLYAIWRDLVASATLDKELVNLTIGGSSDTVTASTTNITNPTYAWARLSGDDCVALTNGDTATVTIAVNTTRFASCVVRLTINGELGGNAITPITKDVTVKISRTAASTVELPFTVAEAKTAIDELTTISDARVSGIISQIDEYNSTYHSITYWISDDGTTTNQLEVYSGKGLNGNNFTSVDDVELGAQVVVSGNLKKFNTTTYEFDKNNQLVSYQAPSRTLESIALSGTYPTEFLTGDAFSHEGMVVTATYDNGSHRNVTNDATFEGYNMSVAGEQEVTVSYEEDGVTKTATYNITLTYVERTNFNLYQESTIAEGDYIFYYGGYSIKNTIVNNRASYETVQVVNNTISNYHTTNVWHIAQAGEYYTIYNANVGKFLASTNSDNKAKLEDNVTDNSLWTATMSQAGTYEFVNKARDAANGNKYLRNNGDSGWACYSGSTGGELKLFKRETMSYLKDAFATEVTLLANETNEGVDSVSIKFTTKVAKYVWDTINSEYGISEFGMMGYGTRKASPSTVAEKFDAEQDKNNPTTLLVINADTYGLTLDEEGDYYTFTVKVNISGPSNYDLKFIMAPYVVVDGVHHFLDNMDPSVNYLAQNGLVESQLSAEALATLSGQGE